MELFRKLSAFWVMFHVFLLFIMLFRSRYPRKKTFLIAGSSMGGLMLLNAVGVLIFGYDVMGKAFLLTCTIPSFILFYLLSADKKARFILTFCLADTSCLWIVAVTLILDEWLGGGKYILMFISRLLAFPLMEYLTYRYLRKPYLELQDSVKDGWSVFAGMTALYYILLAVMIYYPSNIVERPEDVFPCILVLVLMFFNYATIFSALYRQFLLYQKQQSERVLQEQKAALAGQLESQQRIRKMKHDMKGHTIMLSGLLAAGKEEEALEYLEHVKIEMDTLTGQFCVNPYIDAVFVRYFQKFKEIGAACHFDVRIGEEALPYMELCQILSNGLENAFDALKELEEEKREVSVQIKYNKDYLLIRVKNSCKEDKYVEKGTLPPTDKKGNDHGFGLPSVQEAARKLGGDMLCYAQFGLFVLDVMVRTKSAA